MACALRIRRRLLCLPIAAQAQSAAEFYKDRQIQLVVGYEVGNDYDIGARLLAKYLSKQLPGQPTIVVQNMPQAAGVVAANYLYMRAAARRQRDRRHLAQPAEPGDDGAAQHRGRPAPLQLARRDVVSRPGLRRRHRRAGARPRPTCSQTELLTGGVGVGSSTSIVPTVINRVLGTKFKMIEGYRGAQDILLAIERGEVQGVCMSLGQFRSHEQKFKDGKLRYPAARRGEPAAGRARRAVDLRLCQDRRAARS